ncbi:hypothetical protein F01_400046 [Burkholderia cenocepacia]|nr:hypothetical protein F01_400046 [Burkholderia cenocepacia]
MGHLFHEIRHGLSTDRLPAAVVRAAGCVRRRRVDRFSTAARADPGLSPIRRRARGFDDGARRHIPQPAAGDRGERLSHRAARRHHTLA